MATKTKGSGDSSKLLASEAAAQNVDELAEPSSSDLTADLPASLTIDVTLPEQVHSAPEEELAVAIGEIPVDPGFVQGENLTTTSISLVPELAESEQLEVSSSDATQPGATQPDASQRTDSSQRLDPSHTRRDRLRGEVSVIPESAAALTADRLIETRGSRRRRPEGRWPAFLYAVTLHVVNIGDSPRVRERKALDARIDKAFEGGARFIPVLTRKGGVGKTTITALLGMAMADVREDRVVAIDANPDRGTLAERINKQTRSTVRDVVTRAASINSFSDFTALVSRDETRLDILASDTDPLLSEAFDENDYNVVADLAARFYTIVLTDCGTGIVHSVMRATLQRADSVVIVSGGSIDEARLASETLTWLEANGFGELVRNAVVALNTATQGTNLVKIDEIEAHFRSRVREIVRIPYDPQLAAGSAINYATLKPLTRDSARELAALVADGLPVRRDA